jgi:hypothetical protein
LRSKSKVLVAAVRPLRITVTLAPNLRQRGGGSGHGDDRRLKKKIDDTSLACGEK